MRAPWVSTTFGFSTIRLSHSPLLFPSNRKKKGQSGLLHYNGSVPHDPLATHKKREITETKQKRKTFLEKKKKPLNRSSCSSSLAVMAVCSAICKGQTKKKRERKGGHRHLFPIAPPPPPISYQERKKKGILDLKEDEDVQILLRLRIKYRAETVSIRILLFSWRPIRS